MTLYLVLRGPLGAGKSTLAEKLASFLGGPRIAIDRILEEHQLEEWDEDCISERSFLRANEVAVREAEPLLQAGTPVVFDGNFYWRSVIEDLERRLPFPHLVVTLKVPLEACIARDASRTPSYGADAAREVYAKTTSFRYGSEVDASGPVQATADRIVGELQERGLLPRGREPRGVT